MANFLFLRYRCPACGVPAFIPFDPDFKCKHCETQLRASPFMALLIATCIGSIPTEIGINLGEVAGAIGSILSLPLFLLVYQLSLNIRRRDAF